MTSARTPAIELRDVSRAYVGEDDGPATRALDGIDLEVARGELVAVCGPSGSGKSTFLHLAGALDTPTTGQVLVDGVDIAGLSAAGRADLRNRAIGFVFQAFNLMVGLTVTENVGLPAVLAKRKPAEVDARVADLLDLVDLRAKADRRPSQLSGGEQQRVALARALVLDPPIVLADEPTGNLDTNAGRAVLDLLLAAHAAGRTVVIVTHDQRIAAQAERVVYLRDGKLAQETQARPAPAALTGLLDTTVG
jgi:putative ABC transport system ATP-binding protein